MNSLNEFETAKRLLATSPTFDVEVGEERLIVVHRRKFLPRRGVFRMFAPQIRAVVINRPEGNLDYSVRPDSLAIFIALMLVGAIAVELLMDREQYPREYPAGAVYGFTVFYIGVLSAEMVYVRKQLNSILE